MNLGNITIVARARTSWEAIDLGFVMLRHWWKPLFLSWFIPSACVFIPLLLIFNDKAWIAITSVWWLKPLWDRGTLFVASRSLFGETSTFGDVSSHLREVYKTDLITSLTLRRFSVTRSFDMPLTVLEKAKGRARSTRINQLHPRYGNAATWLTMVMMHIEVLFIMGMYSLVLWILPADYSPGYLELIDMANNSLWLDRMNAIITFGIFSLVGPIYAVTGFALYISRRIELEAWDIEIQFRRMAARQAEQHSKTQGLAGIASSVLLVLVLCVSQAQPVYAQDESQGAVAFTSASSEALDAKQLAINVLAGEEFHTMKTVKSWRLKDFKEPDISNETPEWVIAIVEFFERHWPKVTAISEVFKYPFQYIELILWGLFIVIVGAVLFHYRRLITGVMFTPSETPVDIPDVMFGLDLRQESLPDDIPATVQALWERGQIRDAVSLLYRALLSELIHQQGFAFAESYTEGECLALVRRKASADLTHYAQELTHCWQQLAYGHITPKTQDVEALCQRWQQAFAK